VGCESLDDPPAAALRSQGKARGLWCGTKANEVGPAQDIPVQARTVFFVFTPGEGAP
jgi:hypothetical protein